MSIIAQNISAFHPDPPAVAESAGLPGGLANGKGNPPVVIPWAWGTPVQVEIGWDGKQYELRACYDLSQTAEDETNEGAITPQTGEVAGVDLAKCIWQSPMMGWGHLLPTGGW
jgi:hypothetical protein